MWDYIEEKQAEDQLKGAETKAIGFYLQNNTDNSHVFYKSKRAALDAKDVLENNSNSGTSFAGPYPILPLTYIAELIRGCMNVQDFVTRSGIINAIQQKFDQKVEDEWLKQARQSLGKKVGANPN